MFKMQICYAPEGVGDLTNPGVPSSPVTGDGDTVVTGDAPVGGLPASGEPSTVEPPPQTVPAEIFRRRVAELTRKNSELQAQLAQAPQPTTPIPIVTGPNVAQEARIIAEQMRIDEKSQAIANAGQAMAPDFLLRVNNVNMTVGTLSNSFLEALAEAGDGDATVSAKVLYDLSGDLTKAATILQMSPAKQAIALAKLAQGVSVKKPVAPQVQKQTAPEPITPKIGGGRVVQQESVDVYNDKTDIDSWMQQRDATAKKRR